MSIALFLSVSPRTTTQSHYLTLSCAWPSYHVTCVFLIGFHLHTEFQLLLPNPAERLTPPSFTKKLSETVEETEGNTFKLEGRVAGSQPITVAWYKNNIEIHPTSNCEITFKNNVLLLQVKKAGVGDAGLYTCKVSNDAGSALCTSSVVIKGQFSSRAPAACLPSLPVRQSLHCL